MLVIFWSRDSIFLLKNLSVTGTDIKKGAQNRKILDQDIEHGMERRYKPVIDPIKRMT